MYAIFNKDKQIEFYEGKNEHCPIKGDNIRPTEHCPSQHPSCLGSRPSFGQLSVYLRTLAGGPGYFPLGHGP